jgi:AcrR family transcriptional regulator
MPANDGLLAGRREEILTAAGKVFGAHEYASATMEAVAAEAGISKGSIYNYFKNKHDLFVQLFSDVVGVDEMASETLLSGPGSAKAKLERFLDEWTERVGQYKQIGGLVLEFWLTAAHEQRDGELASWFGEMYARWRDMIARTISEGIAAGEFRIEGDAQTAAALMLSVLDGIIIQVILDFRTDMDEEFFAALKRAILSALDARPSVEKV